MRRAACAIRHSNDPGAGLLLGPEVVIGALSAAAALNTSAVDLLRSRPSRKGTRTQVA
jgi:hypothetical protein